MTSIYIIRWFCVCVTTALEGGGGSIYNSFICPWLQSEKGLYNIVYPYHPKCWLKSPEIDPTMPPSFSPIYMPFSRRRQTPLDLTISPFSLSTFHRKITSLPSVKLIRMRMTFDVHDVDNVSTGAALPCACRGAGGWETIQQGRPS